MGGHGVADTAGLLLAEGAAPELFAGFAVYAEEEPGLGAIVGGGADVAIEAEFEGALGGVFAFRGEEIDTVTEEDGAGVAEAGDGEFPEDVFVGALGGVAVPGGGQLAGDEATIAFAAKERPIGGGELVGREGGEGGGEGRVREGRGGVLEKLAPGEHGRETPFRGLDEGAWCGCGGAGLLFVSIGEMTG